MTVRVAVRVVRNQYDFVLADIFDNLFVLAFLVGIRPVTHSIVVSGCTADELTQEVSIAVKNFLSGK